MVWVTILIVVFALFSTASAEPQEVHALYLPGKFLCSQVVVADVKSHVESGAANAVVIDLRDNGTFFNHCMSEVTGWLKDHNVYLIGRIVVGQDSIIADARRDMAVHVADQQIALERVLQSIDRMVERTPEVKKAALLKTKLEALDRWYGDGRKKPLWFSGALERHRYWLDPASPDLARLTSGVAEWASTLGFAEINLDYIRFPTDGDMQNMRYPFWNGEQSKYEVIGRFASSVVEDIKRRVPGMKVSADIFGIVCVNGAESSTGQRVKDFTVFDYLACMGYASHFRCGDFGFSDPNQKPYEVTKTVALGLARHLAGVTKKPFIRPWIEGFTIPSIYQCSTWRPPSAKERFRQQIRALAEHGIKSWMIWNTADEPKPLYEKIFR
ncbi:MAG: hypothetical protein HY220_00190 [Candidatus Sungbacteria bacterium]|uniref:DUF4015 domain-containing protein n=1 Tax=Candidatus Sungiibacteriota bacterium TaxID=2750080 RepID=A0A9D6QTP9_9BACT|nr:hypothetical protein [Candidatus Sungbacteria bacterium]